MLDMVIIGSGPAGLSAAVYGVRAGLDLIVIEKSPVSGGQIINTYEVDNYLGLPGINGFDMGTTFRAHADKLGAKFVNGEVTSIEDKGNFKVVHTDQGDYETATVVLCTGAEHAHLGVPGEEELNGMGVSYCATCDGAFFKGRDVAVVGGGDVALGDVIYLARGCRKVYLIHRRDEFRGAVSLQEKVKSLPNVEILYSHIVKSINGEDGVESITVKDIKNAEDRDVAVSGVFVATGINPVTELVSDLVKVDDRGYVIAGEDCVTSCPGIFVAGDARQKILRQVITAVADGANATVSVEDYLKSLV